MNFIKNDPQNWMNDELLSSCLVPYVEKFVLLMFLICYCRNISRDEISLSKYNKIIMFYFYIISCVMQFWQKLFSHEFCQVLRNLFGKRSKISKSRKKVILGPKYTCLVLLKF